MNSSNVEILYDKCCSIWLYYIFISLQQQAAVVQQPSTQSVAHSTQQPILTSTHLSTKSQEPNLIQQQQQHHNQASQQQFLPRNEKVPSFPNSTTVSLQEARPRSVGAVEQNPVFNTVSQSSQNNSPFLHPADATRLSHGISRQPQTTNDQTATVSFQNRSEPITAVQGSVMYHQLPSLSQSSSNQHQQHQTTTNLCQTSHAISNISNSHQTPIISTSVHNPLISSSSLHSSLHVTSASPSITSLSSSIQSVPPSLANFQIDPDTGLPLSIINLQNSGMLKTTPTPSLRQSTVIDHDNISSGMLLSSRDPVLSASPFISEPTCNTPTQPLTVNVSTVTSVPAGAASTGGSPPLISPTVMSSGLLSPTRHSLLSPSEVKKTSQQGVGFSGLGSLKVSLLLEPGSLPQPPPLPQPSCPVEKLSPPTPSIRVSFFPLKCFFKIDWLAKLII